MGANTYIGNAPNFMVKSIAEENDIKMPSFFGYMMWSGILLLPIFIFVSLLSKKASLASTNIKWLDFPVSIILFLGIIFNFFDNS